MARVADRPRTTRAAEVDRLPHAPPRPERRHRRDDSSTGQHLERGRLVQVPRRGHTLGDRCAVARLPDRDRRGSVEKASAHGSAGDPTALRLRDRVRAYRGARATRAHAWRRRACEKSTHPRRGLRRAWAVTSVRAIGHRLARVARAPCERSAGSACLEKARGGYDGHMQRETTRTSSSITKLRCSCGGRPAGAHTDGLCMECWIAIWFGRGKSTE